MRRGSSARLGRVDAGRGAGRLIVQQVPVVVRQRWELVDEQHCSRGDPPRRGGRQGVGELPRKDVARSAQRQCRCSGAAQRFHAQLERRRVPRTPGGPRLRGWLTLAHRQRLCHAREGLTCGRPPSGAARVASSSSSSCTGPRRGVAPRLGHAWQTRRGPPPPSRTMRTRSGGAYSRCMPPPRSWARWCGTSWCVGRWLKPHALRPAPAGGGRAHAPGRAGACVRHCGSAVRARTAGHQLACQRAHLGRNTPRRFGPKSAHARAARPPLCGPRMCRHTTCGTARGASSRCGSWSATGCELACWRGLQRKWS